MKKIIIITFLLFIVMCLSADQLSGYIKSFQINELITGSSIILDRDKPVRDGGNNLLTNIERLTLGDGMNKSDLLTTLLIAKSNKWGVRFNLLTLEDAGRITAIETPVSISTIPLEGLVAEYLCNGNAIDTSGEGNDGAVYGVAQTTNRFNEPGKAFYFDGVNDYIRIPDSLSLQPGWRSWSISLWLKPLNEPQKGTFLAKRQDGPPYEQYSLGIGSDSHSPTLGKQLTFGYIQTAGPIERSGYTTQNIVNGSWIHIVFIADRIENTIRIYKNGTLSTILIQFGQNGNWPVINNPDPLFLGYNGTSNTAARNFFRGKMDSLRIYNRVLNAAEINELFYEVESTE